MSGIVTILILIDGFLQFIDEENLQKCITSHNPYFNRWFSAMKEKTIGLQVGISHNPYFNRWFSAIFKQAVINNDNQASQSLF